LPANGGPRRVARQFGEKRRIPQAEFTSTEEQNPKGPQAKPASLGNYGGPAKECVQQQIELIEKFVAERK